MIGVGWLVVMDDWLERGGPAGAMIGFALGGLLLLPVGYVYGQWIERLPDAAGEAAYAAQVLPRLPSYLTGWMMLLAYLIVCPWEAIAVGKVAAYIFPALDSHELYRVWGQPVFLPRLLLGVALTLFLCWLNYRGIRGSATFQTWATSAVLLLFLLLLLFSAGHGRVANFQPAFHGSPWLAIFLTIQIVPYFMTGFESVPKVAEEAHPEFRSRGFFRAIALAVVVGAAFYVLAVAAVAYVAPWQGLLGKRFATAVAFEHATGAPWLSRFIMAMAVFALFEVFNGNFVASSRLLFAFGRTGTIHPGFGRIHARYRTPWAAIAAVTLATLAGPLLGDALLVPITEVGSMASAVGWLATCGSFFVVERAGRKRFIALLGITVSALLLAMKLVPAFPGHLTSGEWGVLCGWLGVGLLVHRWK